VPVEKLAQVAARQPELAREGVIRETADLCATMDLAREGGGRLQTTCAGVGPSQCTSVENVFNISETATRAANARAP